MHYNLHERIKIKRYIPYKKIVLILIIVLLLVAAYFVLTQHSVNIQKPPATIQQGPA